MNEEEMIVEWEHFPSFYREQLLAILKRRFPESRAARFEARIALFIPDELRKGTYSLRTLDTETGEIVWHGIEARVQPLAHGRARLVLKWDHNWPEVAELAGEIRRHFTEEGERDLSAAELEELWNSEAEEPRKARRPGPRNKGGRPLKPSNKWAYEAIQSGRDKMQVFEEWKTWKENSELADPWDSFRRGQESAKKVLGKNSGETT